MTVNLPLNYDEATLRRIRAHYGRGGVATRQDVRVWANSVLAAGLVALPEAKVRRRKVETLPSREQVRVHHQNLREAAAAAPPDAVCSQCGATKDAHGRLGYACPAPHRTVFVVEVQ